MLQYNARTFGNTQSKREVSAPTSHPDVAGAPFSEYKEHKIRYGNGQGTDGGALRGHNIGAEAIGATARHAAAVDANASYRHSQTVWLANKKAELMAAWPQQKYRQDGGNTNRVHALQEQENTTPGASSSAHAQWMSSNSAAVRRHPNGLPLRQPTGPLPGMPILSDLVSRYPIKDGPESRVEIALVSGQLFINGRLRTVVSGRRNQEHARSYSAHPSVRRYLPAATRMDPILTVLERRREEKDLTRGLSKGDWHLWQGDNPRIHSAGFRTSDVSLAAQQYVAARMNEVTTNEGRRPMTSPAATGSRSTDITDSRSLATATDGSFRHAQNPTSDVGHGPKADGSPAEDMDALDDVREEDEASADDDSIGEPVTVYQQYSIYQTYGKHQPAGIQPSASMPAPSRQGRSIVFDQRDRAMSSASGLPLRPTSHTVAAPRRDAW